MRKLIIRRLKEEDGKPIFSALKNPLYLKLTDVKTFASGTILHVYHAI